LLTLANTGAQPDAKLLETIRSLNIAKETVTGKERSETPLAKETRTVTKTPNGRKPFTAHTGSVTKTLTTFTPSLKSFSSKENLVNQDMKKVPVSVQKPLQTTRPTVKPVLAVAKPPPVPATPPKQLLLSLPELSLSPGSPVQELEPLSPSQMETDPHRLSQRQKQITYGYRTLGYLRFRLLVPRDKRRKEHPRTPRKEQICSKRSWDGQVKKWRRELHKWDPAPDSGFQELLTADILESLFAGVPGLAELIKGLKEKLAQGTLGDAEDEDDGTDLSSPSEKISIATPERPSVVKTLVF